MVHTGMAHFGEFLKKFAAHRQIAIPELARVSGVPLRTVRRALSEADLRLQDRNVAKLATALGVSHLRLMDLWRMETQGRLKAFDAPEILGAIARRIPVYDTEDISEYPLGAIRAEPKEIIWGHSGLSEGALGLRRNRSLIWVVEPVVWADERFRFRQGSLGVVEVAEHGRGYRRYFGSVSYVEGEVRVHDAYGGWEGGRMWRWVGVSSPRVWALIEQRERMTPFEDRQSAGHRFMYMSEEELEEAFDRSRREQP